mmetsp:Transcript_49782/g.57138  ORF Transcript_49782/g.57138 Transcript_49782/m.57138 type:complete len:228 (+) Transcript_49782:436-1119(+)
MVGHKFIGELISLQQSKLVRIDNDNSSQGEIAHLESSVLVGMSMDLSLQELSSNHARVSVSLFINLDRIVTAVEGNDELPQFVIFMRADQFCFKSENIFVPLEGLSDVFYGSLGVQRVNRAHRVLLGTVSCILRSLLVRLHFLRSFNFNGILNDTEIFLIPGAGEVITIDNQTFTSINVQGTSTDQILGLIIFFLLQRHAGVMSHDGFLGQLLSLEQQGEIIPSGVL